MLLASVLLFIIVLRRGKTGGSDFATLLSGRSLTSWCIALPGCLSLVTAALLCSEKLQSLLVFMHWLNWPTFRWKEPSQPSGAFVQLVGGLLRRGAWNAAAFSGISNACPFEVQGALGMVRGWRYPRQGPGRLTVLYVHGNAGNIAVYHRVLLYRLLSAPPLSCDVVTFDYGGFGQSDGMWPTERTAVADALAVWRSLEVRPSDVIVWGHSLGTGVSLGMLTALLQANSELPGGLILEAPFTSVPDVPLSSLSWLPSKLYARASAILHGALRAHRFPNLDRIGAVASGVGHVAVLHGTSDTVVPFCHGERLAAHGGAALLKFDCGHDDMVLDGSFAVRLASLLKAWSPAC